MINMLNLYLKKLGKNKTSLLIFIIFDTNLFLNLQRMKLRSLSGTFEYLLF
jgi:hypothetical protein